MTNLKARYPPASPPVTIPMQQPIMKPCFTRSQHDGCCILPYPPCIAGILVSKIVSGKKKKEKLDSYLYPMTSTESHSERERERDEPHCCLYTDEVYKFAHALFRRSDILILIVGFFTFRYRKWTGNISVLLEDCAHPVPAQRWNGKFGWHL